MQYPTNYEFTAHLLPRQAHLCIGTIEPHPATREAKLGGLRIEDTVRQYFMPMELFLHFFSLIGSDLADHVYTLATFFAVMNGMFTTITANPDTRGTPADTTPRFV